MDAIDRVEVGPPITGWTARPAPPRTPMEGRYCRIEPLTEARHAEALYAAFHGAQANWIYLPQDPPANFTAHRAWMEKAEAGSDPLFHALIDRSTGKPGGIAAFERITPAYGVIELGNVNYAPRFKRTRAATEAVFLFARRAFDELGYRRLEWKCDSLNAASRCAALRFGFSFEGIFRQAVVYKGRSRDTAWFAIIDRDWPRVRAGFERWLDPANFDATGRQRTPLARCRNAGG